MNAGGVWYWSLARTFNTSSWLAACSGTGGQ